MSRGPRHLFRLSSPATLRALFEAAGAQGVVFDAKATARAAQAQDVLVTLPQATRAKLQTVFSEISALASDLGEDCIRQVAGGERAVVNARFARLQSSYDRVAWVRDAYPEVLQAALSVWFFERRSASNRLADAFAAPETFKLADDLAGLEARVAEIIADDVGEAPRVRVERHDLDDGAVLLAMSHEELWTTETEFNEGDELDVRARRMVHHAAAKIESGMVTIAAERGGRGRRTALGHAIAEEVLGLSGELARLPPLTYNLQRLLDLAPFKTDPAHMITDVLVTALTVQTPGLGDAFDHIFTSGPKPTDIRERMLGRISAADRPLTTVVAAELRVVFGAGPGRSRPRTVRLIFSGPSACRVQLDCTEEALVRSRYLKSWGLIGPRRDAGAPAR